MLGLERPGPGTECQLYRGMRALCPSKAASAGDLTFVFTLQFNLPYFMEKFRPALNSLLPMR